MSLPLSVLGSLDLLAVAADQSSCLTGGGQEFIVEPTTIAQRRKRTISSLSGYPPFQISTLQPTISTKSPPRIIPRHNKVKRVLSDPRPSSSVKKINKLLDCDDSFELNPPTGRAAGTPKNPLESNSRRQPSTRMSLAESLKLSDPVERGEWTAMKQYLASPPVTPTSDPISRLSPPLLGGWEEDSPHFPSFTTISSSSRLQFSPISPLPRRFNQVLIPSIPLRPTMPFSCSCTSL